MIGTHFLHLTRGVRSGPPPLLQNCGLQRNFLTHIVVSDLIQNWISVSSEINPFKLRENIIELVKNMLDLFLANSTLLSFPPLSLPSSLTQTGPKVIS